MMKPTSVQWILSPLPSSYNLAPNRLRHIDKNETTNLQTHSFVSLDTSGACLSRKSPTSHTYCS